MVRRAGGRGSEHDPIRTRQNPTRKIRLYLCICVENRAAALFVPTRGAGRLVDQLLLVFVQAASRACNMVQLK